MRDVNSIDKPLFERKDDADLKKIAEYPAHQEDFEKQVKEFVERHEFRDKVKQFLAAEHAIAIVVPICDGRNGGGSGGTFDDSSAMGWGYKCDHVQPLPLVVMAIESYGACTD